MHYVSLFRSVRDDGFYIRRKKPRERSFYADLYACAESAGNWSSPREITQVMSRYSYVYVLRSLKDNQSYVGLTRDLPVRVQQHNNGLVTSTKKRVPFELVYWEGCLNQSDAAQREKYLKSAWGKRYIKSRLQRYLTG
jgi:putative endonuclease